MNRENFLSEKQLAKRWLRSCRTLQGWRLNNEGPAYIKVGGNILYKLSAVKTYEIEHHLVDYTARNDSKGEL